MVFLLGFIFGMACGFIVAEILEHWIKGPRRP